LLEKRGKTWSITFQSFVGIFDDKPVRTNRLFLKIRGETLTHSNRTMNCPNPRAFFCGPQVGPFPSISQPAIVNRL